MTTLEIAERDALRAELAASRQAVIELRHGYDEVALEADELRAENTDLRSQIRSQAR